MCTTKNSTKKRGARACKPARNHHHTQEITTRARDVRTTGGSELQNRSISAPQETSLPRGSTRTQRCVPKRLMSSFPLLFNKEDAGGRTRSRRPRQIRCRSSTFAPRRRRRGPCPRRDPQKRRGRRPSRSRARGTSGSTRLGATPWTCPSRRGSRRPARDDGVAKLPLYIHETRRISDGHVDGVEATATASRSSPFLLRATDRVEQDRRDRSVESERPADLRGITKSHDGY